MNPSLGILEQLPLELRCMIYHEYFYNTSKEKKVHRVALLLVSKVLLSEAKPVWSKLNTGKGVIILQVSGIPRYARQGFERRSAVTWADPNLSLWSNQGIRGGSLIDESPTSIKNHSLLSALKHMEIVVKMTQSSRGEEVASPYAREYQFMQDLIESAPELRTIVIDYQRIFFQTYVTCLDGHDILTGLINTATKSTSNVRSLYMRHDYELADPDYTWFRLDMDWAAERLRQIRWSLKQKDAWKLVREDQPHFTNSMVGALHAMRPKGENE